MTIKQEAVTPVTIVSRLLENGIGVLSPPAANAMTVLKVDIDSIDCEIMEAVLAANHRPELIIIETNPAYPPPVLFTLKYGAHAHKWFHGGGAHHLLYGCSLSHATTIARRYGYALVQFVVEDAYFVRASERPKFGTRLPSTPAECFALGNPFTYYFDPAVAYSRSKRRAAGSLARGVSEDWALRGRGGSSSAIVRKMAPLERRALASLVTGNVSELGFRLFGPDAPLSGVVSVGIDDEEWIL